MSWLRPRRGRRRDPARLPRSARRRERPDRRGLPQPHGRLLWPLRDPRRSERSRINGSCYRAVVHALACKALGLSTCAPARTGRARTGKNRALHPHPDRRLGLRRRLPHQQRTHRRPRRLARLVQPAQTTPFTRPSGYELREEQGQPPAVGSEVEAQNRTLRVMKIAPSALPNDPRPCAYLHAP
jgi:hypothetical protein